MRRWQVTLYGPGVIKHDVSARAGVTVWAWSERGAMRKALRRAERMSGYRDWSGASVRRLARTWAR